MSFETVVELSRGIESIEGKLGGKPCIKDTRIAVYIILEWLEEGYSIDNIVTEFEGVSENDVLNVISYARKVITEEIPLGPPS